MREHSLNLKHRPLEAKDLPDEMKRISANFIESVELGNHQLWGMPSHEFFLSNHKQSGRIKHLTEFTAPLGPL